MNNQKKLEKLSKFLQYVLGHSPDEFGLVLDESGFIKIKSLVQALKEENGWSYVKESHINDIFLILSETKLEINNDMIRSIDISNMPVIEQDQTPPKILYSCVRNKAYSHVLEKGVLPYGHSSLVILTKDKDMAVRIGKRRGSNPIILEINTQNMIKSSKKLIRYGNYLYLTDFIPPNCFNGPPLPNEIEHKKGKKQSKNNQEKPGTFLFDTEKIFLKRDKDKNIKNKKGVGWKNEARKIRKNSEKW